MPCVLLHCEPLPSARHAFVLRLFFLLAIGVACMGEGRAGAPQKATSQPTHQIVFERISSPQPGFGSFPKVDIFVMDQNGRHTKRLTNDHRSHAPAWSPDGKEIAFLREERRPVGMSTVIEGYYEFALYRDYINIPRDVFCIDADGRNLRRIGPAGVDAQGLVWFPDGNRIGVRVSDRNALQVLVDTSGRYPPENQSSVPLSYYLQTGTPLLRGGYFADYATLLEWIPPADNFSPTFVASLGFSDASPDLLKSVPSSANKNALLRVISRDGSAASFSIDAYDTAWSADRKRIAYSEFDGEAKAVLYVADIASEDVEGSPRAISDEELNAHSPAWATDGKLAFIGLWKDTSQIFISGADGGSVVQLSSNRKISCFHPSWSPDGKWIVAECRPSVTVMQPLTNEFGGLSSIYLFQVDKPGAKPRQLTRCGGRGVLPPPDCGARNPSFAPIQSID